MKLLRIFSVIEKHYPEVATQLIRNYCTEADAPESERTGQFNLGYNSLKWALCAVNEINPDAVKNLFRDILFEFYARQLPIQQLEVNILTFSAMYPYKAQLKQRNTVDISTLKKVFIHKIESQNPVFSSNKIEWQDNKSDSYCFIINETSQNLTSKIFRETRADAIIFHNPDTHAAGVIFRVNSRLNILAGFKNYLLKSLEELEIKNYFGGDVVVCKLHNDGSIGEEIKIEKGWTTLGDDLNLIINHGNSSVTTDQIIQIIKAYSW